MTKRIWRPGTVLYPLPAVMVSCGSLDSPNIITVAWCGTLCTSPAMTYVSIRPERFSYHLIAPGDKVLCAVSGGQIPCICSAA